MTNQIQIFKSQEFGAIRTMSNEQCETLFCAKDVCHALGYKRATNAIAQHVDKKDALKQGTVLPPERTIRSPRGGTFHPLPPRSPNLLSYGWLHSPPWCARHVRAGASARRFANTSRGAHRSSAGERKTASCRLYRRRGRRARHAEGCPFRTWIAPYPHPCG